MSGNQIGKNLQNALNYLDSSTKATLTSAILADPALLQQLNTEADNGRLTQFQDA